MIKVSAPGKLMLFGEHAVVHGKPCIVTSVNHRMSVEVEKRDDNKIVLTAPDVGVENHEVMINDLKNEQHRKECKFVFMAVGNFFEKYNIKSGLNIKTKSDFSSKVGFGSSSAVTVSMIKALSELFGINMTDRNIFDLSYKTVLDIQGVGSGFDVAAATYGGILFFKKAGEVIRKINVKDLPLIVGYTGVKADTPTLVREINEKKMKYPELIGPVFDLSEKKVILANRALEEGNLETLGELMNFSHGLLNAVGVSSGELEKLIFASRNAESLGAKLSGAGGGDCMITLAKSDNQEDVKRAIEEVGGIIIPVKTNVEGVRIES